MEYITKTPDFCGGFVYTCMENMHVVKRDNDGNLLSSRPIDLIKKGLLTEKGEILDFTDNRVLLQKDGKDVTADRYLFNSFLLKKSMQEPEMKKGLLSFLKPKTPKAESGSTGNAWNKKGGERPGHKYIQRKPNATGDGYIYLYELPSGKQQWQDNDGNTVGDKEHEKYSEFKVGDYIQHEGQTGKIIDGADNIYAVQFGDKTKLIHKGQHLEKLHRDLNLKVGDTIDVRGTEGKIKEIGSKIALVETDKGNFFYKLSSPIVKKTPEEGLKAERDMQIKVMEGEPTGDSEKLKGNYQNSKSYNNWKLLAENGKLTRKNDLRYEDHFDSPMGQLKVSHSFDPETKEATVNINGADNPSLFLNNKNYKIKNVAADGMFLEDENGATDFKYFEDIEKDVDRKINVIEKQEDEKFESLKVFFDPKTGKTVATKKMSREQAIKELNDPDKKLQAIQDAIREKAQAEGSRWKRSRETGPVQSDAEKEKIEQQNEENRQKIKEVLTSPEFADYSADMQQRGFKQSANPLISNKEVQFGGQKYKVRSEYDWKTGEHNNTVDGPFKELTIGNNKHQIYDISCGTVTYIDKDGMHKQITKDELETINGKTLLSPTNAFKGVIGSGTKIFMPNNEQRSANYAIMDLGDIKASHNEKTFLPTEGYPQENGVSVNDRDYENDKNAQKMVDDIAQGWDSRTITNSKEAGQNIIVSGEGFVVSGNNRIMSAKVAAEKYPQKWAEYQADLKNELTNYGFAPQDIEGMKNPVLVKIDHDIKGLSKAELGKYNQDVTKGKDEVQKGMQYADILSKSPKTMNALLSVVNSVDNFSDIYRNAKVQSGIMKTLTDSGIILPQKLPEYFNSETEQLTPQGRDLFETVMLGSVLEADALRATSVDGVKALAGNIKENVGVFAQNAGLRNGYSLKSTLNNAVNLQSRYAKTSEGRGSDFNTFLSQIDMFDNPPSRQDVAMNILAKKEPRVMKSVMKAYNDSAEVEQEGGGMFGEAVPPDEVFHSKIVYGKNPYNGKDVFTPEEQEIIKSFQPAMDKPKDNYVVSPEQWQSWMDQTDPKKQSFGVSIKNTMLKAIDQAKNILMPSKKDPLVNRWQSTESEEQPALKQSTYTKRVKANIEQMGSGLSEWTQVPISGMQQTQDGHKLISVPVFDFSRLSDYKAAPTLYKNENNNTLNCELCGKAIKNLYWIKNDKRKWTLSVGSECVNQFLPVTGEQLVKDAKVAKAKEMITQAKELAAIVISKKSGSYNGNLRFDNMLFYDFVKKLARVIPSDEDAGNEKYLLSLYTRNSETFPKLARFIKSELKLEPIPVKDASFDDKTAYFRILPKSDRWGSEELYERIPVEKNGRERKWDAKTFTGNELDQMYSDWKANETNMQVRNWIDLVYKTPKTSQTETSEFKAWFGNSKIVDKDNKPLRVFHGTAGDFSIFNYQNNRAKRFNHHPSRWLGTFFTPSVDIANKFAEGLFGKWEGPQNGANVMPSYLSIKNPEYINAEELLSLTEDEAKELRELLINKGYDGVIVRKKQDAKPDSDLREDQYIAFYSSQIKSATGNNGRFDQNNPDITKSVKNVILFGKSYQFEKSIDKNKNELLPSKKNPKVNRWQGKTEEIVKGKVIPDIIGINPQLEKEIIEVVNKLIAEYNVKEDIHVKLFGIAIPSHKDPMAYVTRDSQSQITLKLNLSKFRYKKDFEDAINTQIKIGFMPNLGLSPVETLIVHEFAHILQSICYSPEKYVSKINTPSDDNAWKICKYANQNMLEEEACAFMLEHIGKGDELTDRLLTELHDKLKRG